MVAWGLLGAPLSAAPADRSALEAAVRARGLDPDQLIWPWELGPELRAWLGQQAVGRRADERLRLVFHQLLAPSGLAIEYDPDSTGTASEVFHSRRANCLGFTLLFMGLARELGVEARFLRVSEIENYRREGDLIFVSEHITAGYDAQGQARVVEFTLGPAVDYRSARPITDMTALALFYSNRGAEALRWGRLDEAESWLEVAVRLDSEEAAAWTNLGVARRRLGRLAEAEAAYRRAILVEENHIPAYMNLATVLRLQGERHASREIPRLLDRRSNRNPFAYLALGDASLEQGRPEEARRFYRRALRLSHRQAGPRAAMGQWALSSGDFKAARRWLRRAVRLDARDVRTLRLQQLLSESDSSRTLPQPTAARAQPDSEVEPS